MIVMIHKNHERLDGLERLDYLEKLERLDHLEKLGRLEKQESPFTIRAYGKSELALLYFPEASTPHVAVNHLMAWVRRCHALTEELAAIGYQRTAKMFTPREVAIITSFLGEP